MNLQCIVTIITFSVAAALPNAFSQTNDNFVNATLITQEFVMYSGNNSAATSEPGEPQHTSVGTGKSLWWKWTPPVNGQLIVDVRLASTRPVVAVYQGNTVSNLTLLAANVEGSPPSPSGLLWVGGMRAGETYYIALDSVSGQDGNIGLMIHEEPAPPNDDFSGRIILQGLPAADPTPVLMALCTREPGEPNHPGQIGGGTAWWTWTAPGTTTVGIYWGTALYTGNSISNLTLVGSASTNQPVVVVPVEAGATYQFVAYTVGQPAGFGAIYEVILPSNDYFTNATALEGTNIFLWATNVLASSEPGEPLHVPNPTGKSLWWSWTAPADGEAVMDAHSPFGDMELAVYTGDTITNLQQLANTLPGGFFQVFHRPIHLGVSAGQKYYLAVDGRSGYAGDISLQLHLTPTPTNDFFTNRAGWPGTLLAQDIDLGAPGKEAGEPIIADGGTSGRSLWWSFTPATPGVIHLTANTVETTASIGIGVFTGTNVSSLTRVGWANDELYLRVEAGVEYQIALDPVVAYDWQERHIHRLHSVFQFAADSGNDFFVNRVPLTGSSVEWVDNLLGATVESGEPKHNKYSTLRMSRWYTWTAADNGWVYLAAGSRFFAPAIAVYEGSSVKDLKKVARSTFTPGARDPVYVVSFQARSNHTYQIAVDAINDQIGVTAPGEYELNLEFTTLRIISPVAGKSYSSDAPPTFAVNTPNPVVDGNLASVTFRVFDADGLELPSSTILQSPFSDAPTNFSPGQFIAFAQATNNEGRAILSPPVAFTVVPANDSFSNAVPMTGFQWHVDGTLTSATLERGEPTHPGRKMMGSVWYSWTAPESGLVEIQTSMPESIALDIFAGSDVRRLKRVPALRPNLWTYSFQAVSGTTYRFAACLRRLDPAYYGEDFSFDVTLQAVTPAGPTDGAAQMLTPTIVPVSIPATSSSTPSKSQQVLSSAPALRISLEGNQVKLQWTAAAGWALEATTDLSSATGWQAVPVTPIVEDDQNVITLPATSDQMFFRLQRTNP